MARRALSVRQKLHSRRGAVMQITAALIAAGVVTWAGIAVTVPPAKRAPVQPQAVPAANRLEIQGTLGNLGLEPKALAAAGFSASQVSSLVAAGVSSIRADISSLRQTLATLGGVNGEYHRLRDLIQGGRASTEDRAAFAAAQTMLGEARTARQAAVARVYEAAMEHMPADVRARHETIRTNASWGLATPYLSVARTEAEWLALRDAFANERIAARIGEDPDARGQQLLLSARSSQAVSAAMTATQSNLEAITLAWNQAVGE